MPLAAGAANGVAFMLDQCHNIEDKIPGQIRSVMNVQEASAKALLVDAEELRAAQLAGDVLAANAVLMDAYNTDVRPLLAQLREDAEDRGVQPVPEGFQPRQRTGDRPPPPEAIEEHRADEQEGAQPHQSHLLRNHEVHIGDADVDINVRRTGKTHPQEGIAPNEDEGVLVLAEAHLRGEVLAAHAFDEMRHEALRPGKQQDQRQDDRQQQQPFAVAHDPQQQQRARHPRRRALEGAARPHPTPRRAPPRRPDPHPTDTHTHPHPHRYTHTHRYPHADADTHPYAHTDSHSHANPNTDANTHTNRYPHANGNPYRYTHTNRHPHANPNVDANNNTDLHPHADTDTDRYAHTD